MPKWSEMKTSTGYSDLTIYLPLVLLMNKNVRLPSLVSPEKFIVGYKEEVAAQAEKGTV